MTTIRATMIEDSVSRDGIRLSTLELRYPRPIHAEFMTHRAFSRNAASSRAIPVERLIQDVLDDPFVPMHWGKDQRGMQAHEEQDAPVPLGYECIGNLDYTRDQAWIEARNRAVGVARAFASARYHKQVVNRLLEPFAHINVVVSATDWANFLHLRDHADAEPHIAILAREVRNAMDRSRPTRRGPKDWHLPYVDQGTGSADSNMVWKFAEDTDRDLMQCARILSAARCASVSYKTVDGKPMTMERAFAIYEKLAKSDPLHASPFEHQASPDISYWASHYRIEPERIWRDPQHHGNFRGWRQWRKMMPNETVPN